MTYYIVRGTKETEYGPHTVSESARSRIKAEWVRASYVECGYQTSIEEVEETPT